MLCIVKGMEQSRIKQDDLSDMGLDWDSGVIASLLVSYKVLCMLMCRSLSLPCVKLKCRLEKFLSEVQHNF